MPGKVESIRVAGIHPVEPTQEMLDVYALTWGTDEQARQHNTEHFAALYLIEIEVVPPDAKIDWARITQPDPSQPKSNWQAPWDERPLRSSLGHWAFFMHFVDLGKPLDTQVGTIPLPQPTPTPFHLSDCIYELPG